MPRCQRVRDRYMVQEDRTVTPPTLKAKPHADGERACSERHSERTRASTSQPLAKRQAVPAEIAGQPAEQLEIRLAVHPVVPSGRHLTDPVASEKRFHGDLQRELEAGIAFQYEGVEQRLSVHLEGAG